MCGVAATTGAAAGTGPVGASVGAVATGVLAAGAGDATGAATGEVVTGVTTSFAVTDPLIPCFCTLPIVPRAFRVARLFATETAFSSADRGARALGGASPKSANLVG